MNIKRILFIQIIITLILSVSLFFIFDYTLSIGVVIGSLLGYFSFYSLRKRINELTDDDVPDLQKNLKSKLTLNIKVIII